MVVKLKNEGYIMEKAKYAVLIYPNFSLQEITCITACLAVWFGEKMDIIGSEKKLYMSEDGFAVMPAKSVDEVSLSDYQCIILPGTVNPLPALYDEKLIGFLEKGKDVDIIFAAISSAPLLLAKAGILKEKDFSAGFFMQMAECFPFVELEHFVHKPVVVSENVVTGIGMFYREFAETVMKKLGYEVGDNFMDTSNCQYTEEELTFYWTQEEYQEFLEELSEFEK